MCPCVNSTTGEKPGTDARATPCVVDARNGRAKRFRKIEGLARREPSLIACRPAQLAQPSVMAMDSARARLRTY